MTFEELARLLPNGLHDAQLNALRIDYSSRTVVLEVDVDIGGPDQTPAESYRPAHIVFSDLQFIAVDGPGPPYEAVAPSSIDAGSGHPFPPPYPLPPLADDAFLCWIFLFSSNSYIHISAKDVEVSWLSADLPTE